MPLPRLKADQLCQAKSRRTKQPCKNPAAYGMKTCRIHGARKPDTVRKGANHPQYRHGNRSKDFLLNQSQQIGEMQALEKIGFESGVLVGKKTRGPKSLCFADSFKALVEEFGLPCSNAD